MSEGNSKSKTIEIYEGLSQAEKDEIRENTIKSGTNYVAMGSMSLPIGYLFLAKPIPASIAEPILREIAAPNN